MFAMSQFNVVINPVSVHVNYQPYSSDHCQQRYKFSIVIVIDRYVVIKIAYCLDLI